MMTHGIKVVRTSLAQWKMMLIGKWLLVKPGYAVSQDVYNHEGIHLAQERELAYVGFYLWYIVEFIVRFLMTWNCQRAYRSILFECEAYMYEHDMLYIGSRRRYAWMSND